MMSLKTSMACCVGNSMDDATFSSSCAPDMVYREKSSGECSVMSVLKFLDQCRVCYDFT
jgi:hypothetical protein